MHPCTTFPNYFEKRIASNFHPLASRSPSVDGRILDNRLTAWNKQLEALDELPHEFSFACLILIAESS
jgi:hypothetical protein